MTEFESLFNLISIGGPTGLISLLLYLYYKTNKAKEDKEKDREADLLKQRSGIVDDHKKQLLEINTRNDRIILELKSDILSERQINRGERDQIHQERIKFIEVTTKAIEINDRCIVALTDNTKILEKVLSLLNKNRS